ncbi:glutathione S-transferase family protein [Minwuia sp.]|uniref:glutathione S-transferase family protein n=1 Tax=Minwuia sp. TaxID=2493630 RepID=UPI003A93A7AB
MTIQMYDLCGAEADRRFSPFCWRTRFALAHKRLDHETIPWRFLEKDVIAAHGSKTVPVIIDGETKVSDSWAIAEYLEDTYADRPALFPNGRGETRFIKSWAEAVLTGGIFGMIVHDIYRHLDADNQAYFRETREQRLGTTLEDFQSGREQKVKGFQASLAPLRLTLKSQPFVAGDQPAFADHLCMSPFMFARGVSDFQLLEADDAVNDWRNRMLDHYDGLGRRSPGYDW